MNLLSKDKIILLIFTTIAALAVYLEFSYDKNNYFQEKYNDLNLKYSDKVIANKMVVEALFDNILQDKNMIDLMRYANKEKDKNIYREKLYNLYIKDFNRMKKKGILQFHFHLANGDSFLRFHKPSKFGDSLLFRKSINNVIKTKKDVFGFELGRYFEGFRYVYPIINNGEFLGSVEASLNTKNIINQMTDTLNGHFSIILNTEALNKIVNKEHIKKCFKELSLVDGFSISRELYNEKIEKELFASIGKDIKNDLINYKTFTVAYDSKLITFLPLLDLEQKNIGYIFSFRSDDTMKGMIYFQVLKFISILFLFLLIYYFYNRSKEKSAEVLQILSAIDKTTLISKSNPQGKITYASDAFCKVSGYSKEELIGKNHNIVRDPSMSKEAFEDMWETIKNGKIWNGIVTNRKKDGSQYVVNATILPLFDNNNKIKEYIGIRHDISELESYKNQLEHKLSEYTKLVDKNVIISTTDKTGKIIYASEAFCKISGYSKEELINQNHNIVRDPSMPKEAFEDMWKTIKSKKSWQGEVRNKKKNGGFYWVNAVITPNLDKNGDIISYTGIRQDITDRKLIEEISQKDKLTQIYNRVKLDEVLLEEIERNRRYGIEFSTILIDIDKFKEVNDNYGHPEGDSVLKETSKILTQHIRKTDILGRWGGEEFLIISTSTNINGVIKLAENLRKAMEEHQFKYVGKVTASFGVTQYIAGETEASLLKRCDDGLYKAKRGGRNRVEAILDTKGKSNE